MRRLTDAELSTLAQQHIGLNSVGAADIFSTKIAGSVDTVLAAVAPFLSRDFDPVSLRKTLEAIDTPDLHDYTYEQRLRVILTESRCSTKPN